MEDGLLPALMKEEKDSFALREESPDADALHISEILEAPLVDPKPEETGASLPSTSGKTYSPPPDVKPLLIEAPLKDVKTESPQKKKRRYAKKAPSEDSDWEASTSDKIFPFRLVDSQHTGEGNILETPSRKNPGRVYLWFHKNGEKTKTFMCTACSSLARRIKPFPQRALIRMKEDRLLTDPDAPKNGHICKPRLYTEVLAVRLYARMTTECKQKMEEDPDLDVDAFYADFEKNICQVAEVKELKKEDAKKVVEDALRGGVDRLHNTLRKWRQYYKQPLLPSLIRPKGKSKRKRRREESEDSPSPQPNDKPSTEEELIPQRRSSERLKKKQRLDGSQEKTGQEEHNGEAFLKALPGLKMEIKEEK